MTGRHGASSFGVKGALAVFVVIIASVYIGTFAVHEFIADAVSRETAATLRAQAEWIGGMLAGDPTNTISRVNSVPSRIRSTVIDEDHSVYFDTIHDHEFAPASGRIPDDVADALRTGYGYRQIYEHDHYVLYVSVRFAGKTRPYVVRTTGAFRVFGHLDYYLFDSAPIVVDIVIAVIVIFVLFRFLVLRQVKVRFHRIVETLMSGREPWQEAVGFLERFGLGGIPAVFREHRELSATYDSLSREFLTVFDSNFVGIISIGAHGRIERFNERADELFSRRLALGAEYFSALMSSDIISLVENVYASHAPARATVKWNPESKQYLVTVYHCEVLGVHKLFLFAEDITDIKNAEIMKRDFATNVTHELKTPLTSVIGYAETIAEESGDEHLRGFAERILVNAQSILAIVNDLIEIAKWEGADVKLRPEPVAVARLFEDVNQLLAYQIGRKRIEVVRRVPDGLSVVADRESIIVALKNLLDNAVKFSPEGTKVTLDAGVQEGNVVRISVVDSGPGVEDILKGRIFERFYRIERTRATPGTGLGLSIFKHIMIAHNAGYGVTSGEGGGAEFWFTLPKSGA